MQELAKTVNIPAAIIKHIDSILTPHGKVKDNASAELSAIRRSLRDKQQNVSSRINSVLRKAQSQGILDSDATVTFRNGRPVLPVQVTHKRKIKGFIHDESASGKTVFIEPEELVELTNEIRELEYAENREIKKILVAFTDAIRPYIPDLQEGYRFLAEIDFLRAKALVGQKTNSCLPHINPEPEIDWQDAIHPLLFLHFKPQNKTVVPLTIRLNQEQRILLISGPNAGGKSVCLKTVGLLQYMFQAGMLVPVNESSVFGIFNKLFIDIGDEQSIDNDLSTYSSHLHNMKHFVKHADGKSLVLIDEFGTGTEPLLGGAIAESILEHINIQQTFGVITTHYTNLKHFAASAEGIINGAMLYDNHKMQPLFKLEMGKPGSSFAFEIARKIGLPEEILATAQDKVGKEHIDFDKHLKDVLRDKRYWEQKRSNIRKNEKRLEKTVNRYLKELQEIKSTRKDIISSAKQEAEQIMNSANKQIENTIRKIKESQADKEKTKEARTTLEEFKKTASQEGESGKRLNKKIKELETKTGGFKADEQKVKEKAAESLSIEIGDTVQLVGQDTLGEVMDKTDKGYLVAFGQMITSLPENKIMKVSKNQSKRIKKSAKSNFGEWSPGKRKLTFKSEIDVRGMRAEEALQKVAELIDEATVVGASSLRILHGKGNGILRQLIRDYLDSQDLVGHYGDEHVQFGGAGITKVELSY